MWWDMIFHGLFWLWLYDLQSTRQNLYLILMMLWKKNDLWTSPPIEMWNATNMENSECMFMSVSRNVLFFFVVEHQHFKGSSWSFTKSRIFVIFSVLIFQLVSKNSTIWVWGFNAIKQVLFFLCRFYRSRL